MMAPETAMHEYRTFLGMAKALVTSRGKEVSRLA